MIIKVLRALCAPLGIACGIGIHQLSLIAGLGAGAADFFGATAGVLAMVCLFFIDHLE